MARSLVERMTGAARLDVDTYEEVEADGTANGQAAMVVVLVAVAQGIGHSAGGLSGVVGGVIAAVLGWLAWSGITYVIGDKLLGGTATWGELMRTLGFAQAPGVLAVFAVIQPIGGLVRAAVAIWILMAGIVAIRQALDFGTGRAIATALLGWLTLAVPMTLLALIT